MKFSKNVGRISGIPIRLHYSLVILPLFLLGNSELANLWSEPGAEALSRFPISVALLISAGIPISILLHELGHCAVARHYGSPTRDILLTPIGGIAFIQNMLLAPRAECLMALAGPAVSLFLGLLFSALALGIWVLTGATGYAPGWLSSLEQTCQILGGINIMLVLFNMIPAFPMDGGRVLRACLTPRLGMLKATRVASTLGKILSIVFVVVGIVGMKMPGLILIGPLIYFSADREYRMIRNLAFHVQHPPPPPPPAMPEAECP